MNFIGLHQRLVIKPDVRAALAEKPAEYLKIVADVLPKEFLFTDVRRETPSLRGAAQQLGKIDFSDRNEVSGDLVAWLLIWIKHEK